MPTILGVNFGREFSLGGGLWARGIGTICPFGDFPLFYSNFWPNLRAIHVASQWLR